MQIWLSIENQRTYFIVLRIIFAISMTSHIVSLLFLIKYTPQNQKTWRNYMLFIQALLIANDIHMEILLQPVPLFPAPAVLTTGILCSLGVPAEVQVGIGGLLIATTGSSIILCVFHRHQTVLMSTSRFRLGKGAYWAVHAGLLAAYAFPGILFACAIAGPQINYDRLKNDHRNMTWIANRGCYFYAQNIAITITLTLLTVFTAIFALIFMFGHMNYVLKSDNHNRGSQSIKNIQRSIRRLFAQLIIPLFMMGAPAAAIFVAIAIDELASFELCLTLFTLMLFHPIAHNISLICTTPSFRAKLKRAFGMKTPANHTTSIMNVVNVVERNR